MAIALDDESDWDDDDDFGWDAAAVAAAGHDVLRGALVRGKRINVLALAAEMTTARLAAAAAPRPDGTWWVAGWAATQLVPKCMQESWEDEPGTLEWADNEELASLVGEWNQPWTSDDLDELIDEFFIPRHESAYMDPVASMTSASAGARSFEWNGDVWFVDDSDPEVRERGEAWFGFRTNDREARRHALAQLAEEYCGGGMEYDKDPVIRAGARAGVEAWTCPWEEDPRAWSHSLCNARELVQEAPAVAEAREMEVAAVKDILERFAAGAFPQTFDELQVAWELNWRGIG